MAMPELPPLDHRRDVRIVGRHDLQVARDVIVGEDLTVDGTIAAGTGGSRSNITTPADHNLVTWTADPTTPTAGVAAVLGTVYLVKLPIRRQVKLTTLYWAITSGATTPTAGQCWVGLYSMAGARLSQLDVSGAGLNNAGLFTSSIPAVVVDPPYVWAGFVMNAAGAPQLMKNGIGNFGPGHNMGLAAAEYRFAINGTSATTLPSSITPANNTQSPQAWWFGAA